ncbi:mercuric transporter MerT family protein [Citromicrobium bathyomarinum]
MRGFSTWWNGLAAGGGVFAAFGAAACCALPLALTSVGLGSAWLGSISAVAAPYRTPLLVLATVLLVAAAARLRWQLRLALICPADGACGSPTYRALTAIWIVIGAALLAGAFLYG